jgi:hypothetical protein
VITSFHLPVYFNLFLSSRLDGKEVAVKCTDAWKYADMVATLQHEAVIYGELVLCLSYFFFKGDGPHGSLHFARVFTLYIKARPSLAYPLCLYNAHPGFSEAACICACAVTLLVTALLSLHMEFGCGGVKGKV